MIKDPIVEEVRRHRQEHAAAAWLPRNQLFTLDWAEAERYFYRC